MTSLQRRLIYRGGGTLGTRADLRAPHREDRHRRRRLETGYDRHIEDDRDVGSTRPRALWPGWRWGLPGQRNKAVAETSSDAFAILDGDDLWAADKLEQQLAVLEARPEVGLVYADYFAFAGDLSSRRGEAACSDITGAEELTVAYFLNDPPIMPSTTLIRRSAFEACGRFDPAVRVFETRNSSSGLPGTPASRSSMSRCSTSAIMRAASPAAART